MSLATRPTSEGVDASVLASYVPHLVDEHQRAGGGTRPMLVEGTLVSADISGFTALSEQLAELGNEGAEQLTSLLNQCFTAMIEACERRHGDIIKFGGDALLVLFTGEDHARHCAIAMAEMHQIVRGDWSTDSVRKVSLGIRTLPGPHEMDRLRILAILQERHQHLARPLHDHERPGETLIEIERECDGRHRL